MRRRTQLPSLVRAAAGVDTLDVYCLLVYVCVYVCVDVWRR